MFHAHSAAQRGTELHDLASRMVRLGVRLPDTPTTMNLYVNDCIGYRMLTEQPLFVSINCFGTADAINFRKNILRIFDLKTGLGHTTERQLVIYAAMFCIEYGFRPHDIETELRIYQNDEARIYEGDPDEIAHIMDRITTFDKFLMSLREDAE